MTLESHILNTLSRVVKDNNKVKLLFPEGENEKIQETVLKFITKEFTDINNKVIKVKDLIEPVLLLHDNELISDTIKDKVTILRTNQQEKLSQILLELRKNKGLTLEQAQKLIAGKNYYAMMLLQTGEVDCLVAGINFTTADIFKPAFQIIKPKPGINTVTSCFVMNKEEETFVFADCSVNIKPNEEQLVEIAKLSIKFVELSNLKTFNPTNFSEIKLALLSYSTNGSGAGEDVDKMRNVTEKLKQLYLNNSQVHIAGEIQFDAAFDPVIRKKKFPDLNFPGSCNIYIFPDLNAANIGYKIAQRMGNYKAIGPIVLGLNKPINDLSRGATVDDIYLTALITCVQKFF